MNASVAVAALIVAAGTAHAQWTDDPAANTPVVVNSGDQTVVKAAVAPDGSSWTGWFDFTPAGVQLRVQRLDAAGNPTFAPEGLTVSANPQGTSVVDWDLRTDDAGNCVLAFVDIRAGGDNDVYAYLISPAGDFLWGPDGVTVSDNADFEADPRVTPLSGGDYAVVWPRFQTNPGLVMQRIAPDGAKAFAGDGVLISAIGTEAPAFVEIIPTEDNGLIASWVRNTAPFMSPRHVRAGKFDADGAPQWGGAAGQVVVMDATVVPIAHRPRLIGDHAGGAFVAWHDTRDGDFDSYLQRIDASGSIVFAPNGVAASSEFGRQQLDPAIAVAPSGDVMMFFRNLDGAQANQSLNAQRFDAVTGARELGDAGVELLAFDAQFKGPPKAVPHAEGAAALLDRQPNLGSSEGVLEMLITAEDGSLINGSPIAVSTAPSGKGRLNLVRDPDGRMIAAWSDTRNGGEDIYAQIVNADGTLGDAACDADIDGNGVLNFFDISGYLALYAAQDPGADLAAPFGQFNFFDISAYLALYNAGCP
jgi:hypothetical protein